MQICKLCSGEIKVPEGESVLKICKDCLRRKDLEGDDHSYQLRQKAIAKNPKVTVYKATNVPIPEPIPPPVKKPVKKLTPMKPGPVKKAKKTGKKK